jgi:hypothetical protein
MLPRAPTSRDRLVQTVVTALLLAACGVDDQALGPSAPVPDGRNVGDFRLGYDDDAAVLTDLAQDVTEADGEEDLADAATPDVPRPPDIEAELPEPDAAAETESDVPPPCAPTAESCNGQDDDCDGQTDEAACDDGNPCTADTCLPNGTCLYGFAGGPCDDGDACTEADVCAQVKGFKIAACQGNAKMCQDNNPCTHDSCDKDAGCQFPMKQDGEQCDDGNPCTQAEVCDHDGKCLGVVKTCGDANSCTADGCDGATGACVFTPLTGAACDDGSACTGPDACKAGNCDPGPAKACDDANPCTSDSCDKATGACAFLPNTATCTDGNACTAGDACKAGKCVAGAKVQCDDGSPCTVDACDPQTGACTYVAGPDGIACSDGTACTVADACANGQCLPGPSVPCSDGLACTQDGCDPKSGACVFTPLTGPPCSDGNGCTSDDTCNAGKCVSGKVTCQCQQDADCLALEDGDACNGTLVCDLDKHTCKLELKSIVVCDKSQDTACVAWTCAPKTGKCEPKNEPTGKLCDADDSVCSVGDACLAGLCKPGPLQGCDDGNPCTDDLCDAKGGCSNNSNKATCQDGNGCTVDDYCWFGACKSGQQKSCDDGNACTAESCQPKTGQCSSLNLDGKICDDGNPCTAADACKGGVCAPGNGQACSDGNPCTTDGCDPAGGGCKFEALWGTACQDGNVCTTGDWCGFGSCQPGAALQCGDNNPCTNDVCVVGVGCVHQPNSVPCSDGNACTIGDVCNAGGCQPGTPKVCAGGPCTDAVCQPSNGACKPKADGTVCSDGNVCTSGEACKSGACVGGKVTNCSDGNPCTLDTCNAQTGTCSSTPTKLPCSDGNACTGDDACENGKCVGNPVTCSDGNACTADSCDPAKGCLFSKLNGPACNDGSACTSDDTCVQGECKGKGISCVDGNPCTFDACNPKTGCFWFNFNGPCSDGNPCTGNDVCKNGACASGAPLQCDDQNPCTDDACDPQQGCTAKNDDSNTCSDGNACTVGDSCKGGKCAAGPGALACNDGNVCTVDSCSPAGGCQFTGGSGQPCNDGNACSTDDVCVQGNCQGANPSPCDDGNACTDDACNPQLGCTHANNQGTCNDGDDCVGPDSCTAGVCKGQAPLKCQDGNPCTVDGCDKQGGCKWTAVADGSVCSDGNPCTTGDACASGACVPTAGPQCDDGNPCTQDGCGAGGGCTHQALDSGTCSDGDPCTLGDTCKAGKCTPAQVASCDDADACTKDACSPQKGCTHEVASSGKGTAVALVGDGQTQATTAKGTGPAVATWDQHPGWTHAIAGATWLWSSQFVQNPGLSESVTFTRTFDVPAGALVVGNLTLASDGGFVCTLNGKLVGVEVDEGNYAKPLVLGLAGVVVAGKNTLVCTVTNPGKPGSTAQSNPAGLLYRIDATAFAQGGALPCSDGSACTVGDWCAGLQCQAGAVNTCDDSNACTADFCDSVKGCSHSPNSATVCSDGDPCTVQDKCSQGVCKGGAAADCNDFNSCTTDTCIAKQGCAHPAKDGGACDDQNSCTLNDVCKGGLCSAANPAPCDDGDACTTDACNKVTGCYHNAAPDKTPCNDGNACTAGDVCQGGKCFGGQATACDDQNPCTTDSCAANGCKYDPIAGGPCEDGNLCTTGEACTVLAEPGKPPTGKCVPKSQKLCNDGEPCTVDACDPQTGLCTFTDSKGSCDDGNPCTLNDFCENAKCKSGTARDCDDQNPCTVDLCDPKTGDCVNLPGPDGLACDDGKACSTGDKCSAGKCVGVGC